LSPREEVQVDWVVVLRQVCSSSSNSSGSSTT
jgi:hypothetical protein